MRCVLATVLSYFLATPGLASDLVPPDPWEVIHTARTFGEADVGRDNLRDPLITGSLTSDDGLAWPYKIGFYGCRLGRACQTIVFQAQLSHEDWENAPPHIDLFDAWNRRKLIGRAFWSLEGTAVLEHPVTMPAGLPKETLTATFEVWKTAVEDFRDFLEFPRP